MSPGVGHGVGDARAALGRVDARSRAMRSRGRLVARRADHRRRATGRSRCAYEECGRLGVRVRQRHLSRHRRHGVVVLALLEGGDAADGRAARSSAVRWCCAMRLAQRRVGGIRQDNTAHLLYRLPFADFGAMLDPPSEDVTAHVIEMFAAARLTAPRTARYRAASRICAGATPYGSWYGRWGVNYVYGTWCVVCALVALQHR